MARILVIDDEEFMVEVLQEILQEAGHEVVCAYDGEEGVRLYHQESPDVVVTDIVMPKKEGIKVIWELRADFPDVKMIAMTGYDPDALPIAEELCVAYIFNKPFRGQDLLEAIENLLGSTQ